jgi:hypothetical protein
MTSPTPTIGSKSSWRDHANTSLSVAVCRLRLVMSWLSWSWQCCFHPIQASRRGPMAGVPLRITLPFDAACHHCATVELLEQHSEVGASSRLNARIVVATIESHVHRLVTAPTPVDFQQLRGRDRCHAHRISTPPQRACDTKCPTGRRHNAAREDWARIGQVALDGRPHPSDHIRDRAGGHGAPVVA